MIPYIFEIAEKYTYFLSTHYKFIENDKIEDGTLSSTTNSNLDPFDYHLEKRGENSFKTLEHTQSHCFYIDSEENAEDEVDVLVEENVEVDDLTETSYRNGTNEVVNVFIQKCVLSHERDSVYAFRKCGHQCICEQRYRKKGDIDILKCVVCRTKLFLYKWRQ